MKSIMKCAIALTGFLTQLSLPALAGDAISQATCNDISNMPRMTIEYNSQTGLYEQNMNPRYGQNCDSANSALVGLEQARTSVEIQEINADAMLEMNKQDNITQRMAITENSQIEQMRIRQASREHNTQQLIFLTTQD